jgi:hypothetical protein
LKPIPQRFIRRVLNKRKPVTKAGRRYRRGSAAGGLDIEKGTESAGGSEGLSVVHSETERRNKKGFILGNDTLIGRP